MVGIDNMKLTWHYFSVLLHLPPFLTACLNRNRQNQRGSLPADPDVGSITESVVSRCPGQLRPLVGWDGLSLCYICSHTTLPSVLPHALRQFRPAHDDVEPPVRPWPATTPPSLVLIRDRAYYFIPLQNIYTWLTVEVVQCRRGHVRIPLLQEDQR